MFTKTALCALALAPAALAQVSDGFESGWDQTKWPIYAPDCNQGGTVTLDSSTAHSGKNSMKVTSPGGYCGHIFFGTNQNIPTGDVYVRTWLKATNALTSSHVSFITMTDAGLPANKHLRIGGQNQVLMYNLETSDATLPDMSPQGTASSVPLPAGSWQCFEYHLKSDGTIETWLNSAAIPGMTVKPGVSNSNAQGWGTSYKPAVNGIYFGWESYGGDTNTFWYDDISISSTRVGCGASSGTTGGGSTPTSTKATTAVTSPVQTSTAPVTTTKPVTSTKVSTTTLQTTTSAASGGGGPTAPAYGQCGGKGWTGPTTCATGYTCKFSNDYYSQCL